MKNNNIQKKNDVIASRVLCDEAIPNSASRLLRRKVHPHRNDMFVAEVML